jgi:hypothetical protein
MRRSAVRKAQPSAQDVHVDAILSNISVAYIQAQEHFIASKVFPIVPVNKQTDKYYSYTKNDWFRDEAQRRADATESAGSGYGLSTASYSCDVFALHKDIGNQARDNADAGIDLDRDATQFVTQRLMLRQEIQWATDYFATSVWATDKTGTTDFVKWSDYTASDPITDIETGKQTILASTGFLPNTLVIGYNVWRYLKHHPDIVDRFKYTSAESITTDMVAKLFEVERILVAKAVKATNQEGETAVMAMVQGSHALLCYVNPTPGLLMPSAGYIFSWKGVSDGLGLSVGISKWYEQKLKADRVEGEIAFDDKIVATDLGYFFSGAV